VLEYLTLGWNAAGIVILGLAAVAAHYVDIHGPPLRLPGPAEQQRCPIVAVAA
jgi:hypothetical protein